MFQDRNEAGRKLAAALSEYNQRENTVVLALPRGGIVPGNIVADTLKLPLDVVLVKKLGHPSNQEYAIGAVGLDTYYQDDYTGISEDYIQSEVKKIQALLATRYESYYSNSKPLELKNKSVIIVDDGVATGRTLIAAIRLIKDKKPKEIIVAVPVGSKKTIAKLKGYVDKVICLEEHDPFLAIGKHYFNFNQVEDSMVIEILNNKERIRQN